MATETLCPLQDQQRQREHWMELPASSPDPAGGGRRTPRPPGHCRTVPSLSWRMSPALLPVSGAGSVARNPVPWGLGQAALPIRGTVLFHSDPLASQLLLPGTRSLASVPDGGASLGLGGLVCPSLHRLAPALCFQMNMQPRFQLNYQKHLSFLPDSTTGMEEEVS